MTAIATIFALLRTSLGLTGGLFSSTVLPLVLVPVLYTLIERARGWRERRHTRRRHAGQHAAP